MQEHRNLKISAREFVTVALTENSGHKPSQRTIAATVQRLVKAFGSVGLKAQAPSAATRVHLKASRNARA